MSADIYDLIVREILQLRGDERVLTRRQVNNQELAAAAPALTRTVQRLELQTPPGDALLGTDTSGLAENFILYSGWEVLPIGGFLGNVPAPTLATLRADISRGYVRVFVLPVSPPGPDPRVRWLESHCTRQPPPPQRRPVPYADFFCGLPIAQSANAATGARTRVSAVEHPHSRPVP